MNGRNLARRGATAAALFVIVGATPASAVVVTDNASLQLALDGARINYTGTILIDRERRFHLYIKGGRIDTSVLDDSSSVFLDMNTLTYWDAGLSLILNDGFFSPDSVTTSGPVVHHAGTGRPDPKDQEYGGLFGMVGTFVSGVGTSRTDVKDHPTRPGYAPPPDINKFSFILDGKTGATLDSIIEWELTVDVRHLLAGAPVPGAVSLLGGALACLVGARQLQRRRAG